MITLLKKLNLIPEETKTLANGTILKIYSNGNIKIKKSCTQI